MSLDNVLIRLIDLIEEDEELRKALIAYIVARTESEVTMTRIRKMRLERGAKHE